MSGARRELISIMRILFWVLLGLAVTGLAFYMITSPWFPVNPATMFLAFIVFGVSPIGSFWMLYVAIRNERRPLPFILLAFLPYTFLWYYFERVRPGKHRTRAGTPA
jgi:hypothetical protein